MKDLAAAAVATSALSTLACGGDDDDTGAGTGAMDGGTDGGGTDDGGMEDGGMETGADFTCVSGLADISANHGHTLEMTLTGAMIANPADVTVDITGTSDHPHTVDLTAADIMTLTNGGSVTKTSTFDDAHDHEVTITCAEV